MTVLKDQDPKDQPRESWSDFSLDDKHIHLLVDHGHRPQRFGGDIEAISDQSEEYCDKLHDSDHSNGSRMPLYIPHDHIPPLLRLPDVGDDLRLTCDGDGWELYFELVGQLANRQVNLRLNEEYEVAVTGMVGDLASPDTQPHLVGKAWVEEDQDYTREVAIRLYHPDGTFNITAVHIL